jgi:D-glycero-D-manno-heptose 1,7-bisphosphate phosphatase
MRLVLLDRDGVINEDSPNHIKSVNEWLPYAGSIEAIARLKQHGVKVAICTNQSGIGLGLFSLAELNAIHAALHAAVRDAAGSLDGIFFCPHTPDAGCACRKPAPGLLLEAMRELGETPEQTVFIGDSGKDLEAARAAGCRAYLVRTGNGAIAEKSGQAANAEGVFNSLADTVDNLIGKICR